MFEHALVGSPVFSSGLTKTIEVFRSHAMSRTWISAGLVSTALTLLTSTAFATDFPEVEPNGTKAEATPVAGLVAGDTISGVCQGTSTTAANVAVTSADTFDLSTAGQAIPGWYEWTLTITTSAGTANTMSVRGVNSVTGTACVVGATAGTTDSTLQSSTGGVIRWYSNEQPSRLLVRVTGSASSASYSAVLGCTPVAAPNAGTCSRRFNLLPAPVRTRVPTLRATSPSRRAV